MSTKQKLEERLLMLQAENVTLHNNTKTSIKIKLKRFKNKVLKHFPILRPMFVISLIIAALYILFQSIGHIFVFTTNHLSVEFIDSIAIFSVWVAVGIMVFVALWATNESMKK